MPPATLALDALFAVATAALFAYVGEIMRHREAGDAAGRRALRLFAVWWYGLALTTLLGAVRTGLVLLGNVDVTTHVILSDVSVVPIVALLWGLVSYLAYIYAGTSRVFVPILVLHLAILAFYGYLVASMDATSVDVQDWAVMLKYAAEPSALVIAGVLITVLVPVLIAAAAYATLYFRTDDRNARYRIGMTSGAFLLWFGSAGVASVTPLAKWYWWPLAARLIGLGATLMILAAYRPPRWARQRYGLETLGPEKGAWPGPRMKLQPWALRLVPWAG